MIAAAILLSIAGTTLLWSIIVGMVAIIPFKIIDCGSDDVYTWIMYLEDFVIKLHKNILT